MNAVYAVSTFILCTVCILAYDDTFISKEDKEDIETIQKLIMKSRVPERYLPDEYFKFFGQNPSRRLKAFSFKNCGDPASESFRLLQFKVTPDPIELPGQIGVSFFLENLAMVTSPIKIDVILKKKILGTYVEVPCIDNIGSCTYSDACDLLGDLGCPSAFQDNGIPCECPLSVGNYTLPESKFEIDVGGVPGGDYSAQVTLSFPTSSACYQIDATLA